MLYALTFRLVATETAELPETQGHFAHAAFLALLRAGDPALAARLHDMNGAKPFTTAVLPLPAPTASIAGQGQAARGVRPRPVHGGRLQPGDERLLRLTLLDGTLYQPLMARFLRAGGPPQITLGAAPFAVAEVRATPGSSPWVGYVDAMRLLSNATGADTICLEFCTPTAFSRGQSPWGKMIDLLPAPTLVFDSLIGKWQAMAACQEVPPPLPDRRGVLEFVAERVVVKQINYLKTVMLRYTTGPQVGFVGKLTYHIKGCATKQNSGPPTIMASEHEGTDPLLSEISSAHWLNALADFVFYSGVGYRTTMGMGQARRVRT